MDDDENVNDCGSDDTETYWETRTGHERGMALSVDASTVKHDVATHRDACMHSYTCVHGCIHSMSHRMVEAL
jgi:hypothetical protein